MKHQKKTTTYQKELLEYIQGLLNKIKNSVEDRQSQIAWPTVNKVSGRESTSRAKVKAASQEERLQKWKESFKNLLGTPTPQSHWQTF